MDENDIEFYLYLAEECQKDALLEENPCDAILRFSDAISALRQAIKSLNEKIELSGGFDN